MNTVRTLRLLRLIPILILASMPLFGQATNVYLANSTQGTGDGSSCANARVWTWFNSSANWGTASAQIGPGTTAHLCGTITAAAGANGLQPQGNGAAGNPVSIVFEPGAVLQSPSWGDGKGDEWTQTDGAAIFINGKSHIVIDGQGTPQNACLPGGSCGVSGGGVIQNTNNGTALAYQTESVGVAIYGSASDVTVRNLTIKNIFVHVNTTDCGSGCYGWAGRMSTDVDLGTSVSNVRVSNNTLVTAGKAVNVIGGTSEIDHNYMGDHCWMMFVGGGTPRVHNNEWTNWANWLHPIDNYHQNGVHAFGSSGNSYYFYSNYVHGDMCPTHDCSVSAVFFNEADNHMYLFNNLMVGSGTYQWQGQAYCNVGCTGAYGNYAYNNTVINTNDQGFAINYSSSHPPLTSENNISVSSASQYTAYTNGVSCAVNAYNDFYNYGSIGCTQGPGSLTSNPNLDSNYVLQASSPGVGKAANLTSLCTGNLAALCQDITGRARPTTGAWDMGAFQYAGSMTSGSLAPPQGLAVTVR